MNEIEKYTEKTFENIKHIDENGAEFWYARELMSVLEYQQWRRFENVIEKAMEACKNSNYKVSDHFAAVGKMVKAGVAPKEIDDYKLTRYACYLIVMNGDSRKEIIALGQTYFAIKTREQELMENYNELDEQQKRYAIRQEMIKHNKLLADAAKDAGVIEPIDYAIFQNEGYKGLYGGLDQKQIHAHKGLKKSQKILDYMGSTELAANLFRATQTEEKLKKDNIKGKTDACRTHYKVGAKVRQTIKELDGTMPENLPTPKEGIKQVESQLKKQMIAMNEEEA